MKLEFDPAADAAYFEISSNEIESTREIESGVMADYDAQGHLVGIEVLGISKRNMQTESQNSPSFRKVA
jgi:uncharacterized protein YuzE